MAIPCQPHPTRRRHPHPAWRPTTCLAPTLTYTTSLWVGHLATFGLPYGEGPGRQTTSGAQLKGASHQELDGLSAHEALPAVPLTDPGLSPSARALARRSRRPTAVPAGWPVWWPLVSPVGGGAAEPRTDLVNNQSVQLGCADCLGAVHTGIAHEHHCVAKDATQDTDAE